MFVFASSVFVFESTSGVTTFVARFFKPKRDWSGN